MKFKKIFTVLCALMLALAACLMTACGDDDAAAAITQWEVPDKYRVERTQQAGEVVPLTYTTRDYALGSEATEEKTCNVYLPFGYDENIEYNIVYLLHGTDKQSVNHIETWLYTVGVKNVLDNMIYYKDIEPLIVVTPSTYSYGLYGDDNMDNIREFSQVKQNSNDNFPQELRNDIIPAVESAFSTYALDTTEQALAASRNHRAMAGLSNGCRLTYSAGMMENFDYISWFGCYSSAADSQQLTEALNSEKYAGYELNYMFNADGIYDFTYNEHRKMVDELLKEGKKFTRQNVEYVEVMFGYHSARSWRVGFYNTLQRFFK